MKKTLKWSIACVAIVGGLYATAIGFGRWTLHKTEKRLDIGYATSINPTLVRLEIGDRVFAIPKNYIWSREDWKGGRATGVNLHALLPDFEPYTELNREEFDKPGSSHKIIFLLREHNIAGSRTTNTSMTRREIYERLLFDYASQKQRLKTESEGPFGLTAQKLTPPRASDDEIYTARKNDGNFYWVQCDLEGKVPSPTCSTYMEFSEHVTIRYTYPSKYLSDWQDIDSRVLNFIRHFELKPKQGEQQ